MQPIETAPTEPLDGINQGPSVLLYRSETDQSPVHGWWGARKGWRDERGRLPFAPKFWAPQRTRRAVIVP